MWRRISDAGTGLGAFGPVQPVDVGHLLGVAAAERFGFARLAGLQGTQDAFVFVPDADTAERINSKDGGAGRND